MVVRLPGADVNQLLSNTDGTALTIEASKPNQRAALVAAIRSHYAASVRYRLESPKFEWDVASRAGGESPVVAALEKNEDGIAVMLVGHPSLSSARREVVLAMLERAIANDCPRAVDALITRFDIDPNATIGGMTLLTHAVLAKSLPVRDLIVNHPRFVPSPADALACVGAALMNSRESLTIALSSPAFDVNGRYDDGQSVLTRAISTESVKSEALAELIQVPELDVNRTDGRGDVPILRAIAQAREKKTPRVFKTIVNLCERPDLDLDVRIGEFADTPLIAFARVTVPSVSQLGTANPTLHIAAVEAVIRREDIDLNAQNASGSTALMEAVRARSREVFRLIGSDERCNLDIVDKDGKDVFTIAGVDRRGIDDREALVKLLVSKCWGEKTRFGGGGH
jgi:hypothetical protein